MLKLAKNKEGERGRLMYLVFDGAHQRFRESALDGPAPSKGKNPTAAAYVELGRATKAENRRKALEGIPDQVQFVELGNISVPF